MKPSRIAGSVLFCLALLASAVGCSSKEPSCYEKLQRVASATSAEVQKTALNHFRANCGGYSVEVLTDEGKFVPVLPDRRIDEGMTYRVSTQQGDRAIVRPLSRENFRLLLGE